MKKILERVIFTAILVFIAAGGMQLITDAHQEVPTTLRGGMALYEIGDYEAAIDTLIQADGDNLAIGNAYFHSGELKENPQEQMALYQQALAAYEAGILKNPQRVDMKYNFEYVKALIEEQQEQEDQSSEENQQDQEDRQENQQNQKGENQQGEDESGQDQSEGDQQEESDNPQSGDGSQNQDSDQSKDQNADEEDNQNQEDSQTSTKEDGSETGQDMDKGEGEPGQLSDEALSQILKLLESQEGESLKNNQQVIQGDHGGGNDW